MMVGFRFYMKHILQPQQLPGRLYKYFSSINERSAAIKGTKKTMYSKMLIQKFEMMYLCGSTILPHP